MLLAACGGGGASSGSGSPALGNNPPQANSWLEFTPASLNLTAYEGRTLDFSITAKSSKTITQGFNIGIVAASGLIKTDVLVTQLGTLEYKAGLHLSDNLAPGNYSSRLEIRLCEDNPATCAKPISGSPWYVPLTVTVKPATNLTPLADVPQLGSWTAAGGNARHTAYLPARFDPAKFTQRWNYSYPQTTKAVNGSPIVHANGAAFIVTKDGTPTLRAIDEASGKALWQTAMEPGIYSVTPPAVASDKVFVGIISFAGHGTLNAYDQKTGKLLNQVDVGEVETQAAPLTVGDDIYVHGRSDSGNGYFIYKINAGSGGVVWKSARIPMSPFQTLTADAQYLYGYLDGNLNLIRQSDGMVTAPLAISTCYRTNMPAVDTQGMLYASCLLPGARPQLQAYDAVGKKLAWTLDDPYAGAVALAGATLYTAGGATLEARRATDGGLLWSAPLSAGEYAPLTDAQYILVTGNLAFVSGSDSVVAVDLSTHQVVWSFPHGGPMAISSKGVLYLSGNVNAYVEGKAAALVAINLQ